MKNLFLVALLMIAAHSPAHASISPRETAFKAVVIELESTSPVTFGIQMEHETSDTCNSFTLYGAIRKVEVPKGSSSDEKYLADVLLLSTYMNCPDGSGASKKVTVNSQETITINPEHGEIEATFYIPADMKVVVVK